ncbi:hypothetical protein A3D70_01175 [Candidatus Adlerbacteria bacterium RIFCSPHIGHO2_02_FULL_54_18]|uniref:Uncharacterized protein n=2 Tax=Candidatus Adleribacteriota TaxID=1752736 RepID=A0A1F4Y4Z6_9BACT|nr:MAG: hypothetical protein A2949_02110 [Candidatus Adlerbacteria bacterium RIFCSPLOWO2_01_FULL_54_21b]OGC89030.1 MAG: hypothetical protein A3D70_01175 [Candidatus Adlerbacteria bacterium RIFCSPHIGHO2_02_FULL_54_18]
MQSKIEQQVMAGVGVIYATRQLVSATALKLYVCALSLYGLAQLVWVARVWENFSQVGLQHSLQFVLSAVLNTHLPVQIALSVLIFVGFSLLLDFVRSTFSPRTLSY